MFLGLYFWGYVFGVLSGHDLTARDTVPCPQGIDQSDGQHRVSSRYAIRADRRVSLLLAPVPASSASSTSR